MPARPPNPMPPDVRHRMIETGVLDEYERRPYYQRNDYLGWIGQAKREDTRERRIAQMLEELSVGGVYMGMVHAPSRRDR